MYQLQLARSAQRDLDQIEGILWERTRDALLRLRDEPRPRGCRKLRGGEATYRVRVGDYRVVYVVDDDSRTVRVIRVKHRSEAYRNL